MSLAASIRAMYAAKNEAVCLAYLLRLPESSGREDRAKEIARADYPTLREAVDELRRSAKTSATVAQPAPAPASTAKTTPAQSITPASAAPAALKAAPAPLVPPATIRAAAPEPSSSRRPILSARTSDEVAAGLTSAVERMVAQRSGKAAIGAFDSANVGTGLDQAVANLVRFRTPARATLGQPIDTAGAVAGLEAACASLAAGRTGGRSPDRASTPQRARDMRSGIDIAREHLWHFVAEAPVALRADKPIAVVFADASPVDHHTPAFEGTLKVSRIFVESGKAWVRAVAGSVEVDVRQIRAGEAVRW